MSDAKRRVQLAMEKYSARDLKEIKKLQGTGKKNKHPERDLVAKPCIEWMRSIGFQVEVYESKATYDPRAGCYRNQSMKAGTSDCQGVTSSGIAVAIEFKAPGKLSTFNKEKNHRQREFIKDRIRVNAFACVVDSLAMLQTIYTTWVNFKREGDEVAKEFLLNSLP